MKKGKSSVERTGGNLGRLGFSLCLAVGICLAPFSAYATHVAFNEGDLGSFPSQWKAREQGGKDVYSVQTDGQGVFLHAESTGNAYTIGHQISIDLEKHPYLNFSWRAIELPEGGNEEIKRTNDGALGVYVVFQGWAVPPRSIKYVWSTTLPEGTLTESPYSERAKIVVLRTGEDGLGEWHDETVNVLDDYRRLFQADDVPKVRGIGILTDSDNTGSHAAGDYRFFRFSEGEDRFAANRR